MLSTFNTLQIYSKMFSASSILQNHNTPRVWCCKYLSLHSCLLKSNGTIYIPYKTERGGMSILTSFLYYLYEYVSPNSILSCVPI